RDSCSLSLSLSLSTERRAGSLLALIRGAPARECWCIPRREQQHRGSPAALSTPPRSGCYAGPTAFAVRRHNNGARAMDGALTTAGIACIIGAVIGGGLKAFGIEIPVIQSRVRQLALAVVGVVLLVGSRVPVSGETLAGRAPTTGVSQS